MHDRLPSCFKYGLIGNCFFVLFSLICLFYYAAYGDKNTVVVWIEALAYTSEAMGFFFMIVMIVELCHVVRHRRIMKVSFSIYILMELVFMVLELNSFKLDFYEPYSLPLAIVHSIISAAVCFSFLSLDPSQTQLEVVVIISVSILLAGMFGNILGIRIYFSILINAISYIFMFVSIIRLISKEVLDIDCKGDKATVKEYRSSFFD